MFQISTLEDPAVRVAPANLALTQLEAITQQLEATYVDKVVPQLGLCVTLYEILNIDGGAVYAGEGAALYTVKFSMVFFRPFVGEVLVGRIKSCDPTGLRVSLGFFEDVHVPEECLQEPSEFDEAEGLWRWRYEGQEEMFMDLEEEVRVRVKSLRFPERPASAEALALLAPLEGGMASPDGIAFAPMVVEAEINSDGGHGMGLLSWWV